jgi:hypothetical protein
MTYGTVIAAVIVSVILPFAVNLIKNKAVSSNAASWLEDTALYLKMTTAKSLLVRCSETVERRCEQTIR